MSKTKDWGVSNWKVWREFLGDDSFPLAFEEWKDGLIAVIFRNMSILESISCDLHVCLSAGPRESFCVRQRDERLQGIAPAQVGDLGW